MNFEYLRNHQHIAAVKKCKNSSNPVTPLMQLDPFCTFPKSQQFFFLYKFENEVLNLLTLTTAS